MFALRYQSLELNNVSSNSYPQAIVPSARYLWLRIQRNTTSLILWSITHGMYQFECPCKTFPGLTMICRTLNTNDLNFGVHVVEIVGTVVSGKVGPVNESTGSTVYEYLGCFHEAYSGPRLFPNEPLSPSNTNDNGNCQTACYGAAKYAFAGTEYGDEYVAFPFLLKWPVITANARDVEA
jgi:hypothetical protein